MPPAHPCPVRAKFKFGIGRMGEVRYAGNIPVVIAGGLGKFAAFLLDADILAFLRKGAFESLGGRSDFPRNILTSGRLEVDVPLEVFRAGHFAPSVASFGMGNGSKQCVS